MQNKIKLPYSLLEYDIETEPLQAHIWRPGEQVVRHSQLVKGHDNYNILTISYKWFGDDKIYTLDYTDPNMLSKFDSVISKADVTIGKNSDSFDVKHINTQRMLNGLPPLPQWTDTADDLEKQLRKYFVFPSQSLDYISQLLGYGGKEKMEFQDWIDISNYKRVTDLGKVTKSKRTLDKTCLLFFKDTYRNLVKRGKTALKKMIYYNQKDVQDTDAVLKRILPYIKLKHNAASVKDGVGCTTCGSTQIIPTKIITKGQTRYQQFECIEHNGYAGRASLRYDKNRNKKFGKMM